MSSASPAPPEGGVLDELLAAEQQLDERLEAAGREAAARRQGAQQAGDERLAARQRSLAAEAIARLEQGRREIDARLAAESRQKEQELAQALATLADLRRDLCGKILAEVWGP
jgi:hypothetical protein